MPFTELVSPPNESSSNQIARVSVVMPVYNGMKYLAETLQTVRQQSHPNVELIVVDDGSTDGTLKFLQAQADVRSFSQKNQGPGAARNTGASQATGTWLAFLDSDDLWEPDKLTKQLQRADDTEADLIYTNSRQFGEVDDVPLYQHQPGTMPSGDLFKSVLRDNFITLSSVMIRKSVFEELQGFSPSESIRGVEDWDLWLRYLNSKRQIAAVDEALVSYRWHKSNMSSSNVRVIQSAREEVLRRAFELDRNKELDESEKRLVLQSSFEAAGWFASRQGNFQSLPMYLQYLRHGGRFVVTARGILRTLRNRLRNPSGVKTDR